MKREVTVYSPAICTAFVLDESVLRDVLDAFAAGRAFGIPADGREHWYGPGSQAVIVVGLEAER